MSPGAFVRPVIQVITGLAKKRYEQWKISSAIDQKMHVAFSHLAESLLLLCSLDATFTREFFRLAAGETVDAEILVALGTAVKRNGKSVVSEAERTAALKHFAYTLVNTWRDISPKAGDVPTAFLIFRDKIDMLATGAIVAARVTENVEAVTMRLVDAYQRKLSGFQQRAMKIGVQTYSCLACSPAQPGEEKSWTPPPHSAPIWRVRPGAKEARATCASTRARSSASGARSATRRSVRRKAPPGIA